MVCQNGTPSFFIIISFNLHFLDIIMTVQYNHPSNPIDVATICRRIPGIYFAIVKYQILQQRLQ